MRTRDPLASRYIQRRFARCAQPDCNYVHLQFHLVQLCARGCFLAPLIIVAVLQLDEICTFPIDFLQTHRSNLANGNGTTLSCAPY